MSNTNPECPQCGRRKHVQRRSDGDLMCNHCGAFFDDDPDEGGDHSTFNPAARLEREDRRRERRRKRNTQ